VGNAHGFDDDAIVLDGEEGSPAGTPDASDLAWLAAMAAAGASDVHVHVGDPPYARVDGELRRWPGLPAYASEDTAALAARLMTSGQREAFASRHEIDFAFELPGVGRFRCNVFHQRGEVGLVLRVIRGTIPDFESLGLPVEPVRTFVEQPRGLVVVTGPTGSGKTTTLASMVHWINTTYAKNIITVEDPIEVVHRNVRSLVVQREIGLDTDDFAGALKYALRQDPDVILIGEMRDKETIEAALTAAQTGHLVLSTLHTIDSVRTVNRIIDVFEPHERQQVRLALADALLGVLAQRLVPRRSGTGRALAAEVMVVTPLIRDYLRDEAKTPQIKDAIMEGDMRGMRTFDQHLAELVASGEVAFDTAMEYATSPHELRLMITRMGGSTTS